MRGYKVTITETLRMTVNIEAENLIHAEQIISDNWKKSEYILDADNFVGVEFTDVPDWVETEGNDDGV
jgi:hypothetical protein